MTRAELIDELRTLSGGGVPYMAQMKKAELEDAIKRARKHRYPPAFVRAFGGKDFGSGACADCGSTDHTTGSRDCAGPKKEIDKCQW